MPAAPRQPVNALQEFQWPLPLGSGAVKCRISTAPCPKVVRRCIPVVALPTTPRQLGSVLQQSHCALPPGSEAVH